MNKELEELRESIAFMNGVKPGDIYIFVDDEGNYYDWAYEPKHIWDVVNKFERLMR